MPRKRYGSSRTPRATFSALTDMLNGRGERRGHSTRHTEKRRHHREDRRAQRKFMRRAKGTRGIHWDLF